MKILEAQSATLTNYEVYTHLVEQEARHKRKDIKGKRPGNLQTLQKELLEYFNQAPSPLASKPFPYNEHTISTLLERLRPFSFTKAEILMIMNLRPTKGESLNTVVEEMEARFGDEQQLEIVQIITEVLGTPDGNAEKRAMVEQTEVSKGQEASTKMEVDA